MEFDWVMGCVGLWVQSFHFAMSWVEETGPMDNSGMSKQSCPASISRPVGCGTSLHFGSNGQGRRHGFESGGGTNSASGASRKFFLTPPLFGQWGGQNIAYIDKSA